MIERYRKAADEKPVTVTVRQITNATGMSRAKAARVILELIAVDTKSATPSSPASRSSNAK
jgi:hypothetical protein